MKKFKLTAYNRMPPYIKTKFYKLATVYEIEAENKEKAIDYFRETSNIALYKYVEVVEGEEEESV